MNCTRAMIQITCFVFSDERNKFDQIISILVTELLKLLPRSIFNPAFLGERRSKFVATTLGQDPPEKYCRRGKQNAGSAFSALIQLKTYLRSTMIRTRHLALMDINNDLCVSSKKLLKLFLQSAGHRIF